jgi:hypothetical protein
MDKLQLIREILQTDSLTDQKIFALIQSEKIRQPVTEKIIEIDEREKTRKPVSLRADINTGRKRIKATVEDVSLCGAFICTKEKIRKGENVAVRLISSTGEEFDFISEVVRVDSLGIGILIKSISPSHQERFRQFFQQL